MDLKRPCGTALSTVGSSAIAVLCRVAARRAEDVALVQLARWQEAAGGGVHVGDLDGAGVDQEEVIRLVAGVEQDLVGLERDSGAVGPLGRHLDDGADAGARPSRSDMLEVLSDVRVGAQQVFEVGPSQDAHAAAGVVYAPYARVAEGAPVEHSRLAKVVAWSPLGDDARLAILGYHLHLAPALFEQEDRRRRVALLEGRLLRRQPGRPATA
eukprot:scaffold35875_cov112-Isochrysis_galbana.AAC.3